MLEPQLTPGPRDKGEKGAGTFETSPKIDSDGDSLEADVVDVTTPEFSPLRKGPERSEDGGMNRFYDEQFPVWEKLGRIEVSLGELAKLSEGPSYVSAVRSVTPPTSSHREYGWFAARSLPVTVAS